MSPEYKHSFSTLYDVNEQTTLISGTPPAAQTFCLGGAAKPDNKSSNPNHSISRSCNEY